MSFISTQTDYGRRLIPNLIDEFAEVSPLRSFCSLARSRNIKDGFRDITYKQMAAAINKLAWWIESRFAKSQTFQPLAYIGPSDLRYAIFTIAAQKTGYKAFFFSPLNSLEENMHLYEASGFEILLTSTPIPHTVDLLSARKSMKVISIPELDELLSATQSSRPYPYERDIGHASKEPFVALHTSGSTGLPKMTVLTHGAFAACDAFQRIPSLGHSPTIIESLRGRRAFLGMPLSLASGVFALLAMPVFYDVIPVLGPPISLTAEIIDEIHGSGNIQASIIRASILEDIANTPLYLERLAGLDCVLNGGCALSQTAGDQIIKKTSIISYMGSTETLLLPIDLPEREDWQFYDFSPCIGAEFRHYCQDLYELVIVRNAEHEEYQPIFAVFPHLSEYFMKDLYSKHPSKPGLWRYAGRCNNVITFSHGNKLNVLPMERIITNHSEVSAAVIVGEARNQSALLIESRQPLWSHVDKMRMVESIWPQVERANNICRDYGRISRDRIIFSLPEMPMVRAKKGGIERNSTVKRYEKKIDALYAAKNLDATKTNMRPTESTAVQEISPTKMFSTRFHRITVLQHWDQLLRVIGDHGCNYDIDGKSLNLTTIVAVARYGTSVALNEKIIGQVEASAAVLETQLAEGRSIYGVNTGYGGSADTRTDDVDKLQRTLINFLNCGILAKPTATPNEMDGNIVGEGRPSSIDDLANSATLNEDPITSTTIPEPWVRATLLVRSNSLACGHSGVRPVVIDRLVELLQKNIIPAIPLRGSISASGDLIPLSYIAAALQGSPDSQVWVEDKKRHGRCLITANEAISRLSLGTLSLQPKEGLAIVNGTAVSAGVGALALHDAHCLAVLSQVLTAMDVEAMQGSAESFDPFLARVDPHAGQIEVSNNIRSFLAGSKLITAKGGDSTDKHSLRQERYSTRTAPQWIGPQLENLMLAHEQVVVEINATTDNPIIDSQNGQVVHGGNFQAMAITSAMEKVRSSLEIIGRMLFAQCTELMNPMFNNGLPPNLTVNEPSRCFLLKGVDISIAALQAELGLLANPVTPHIQTAEMCNQSLNSLAFLSARYTHMALDVSAQLSAAHLLSLCQALDIRVLYIRFLQTLEPALKALTSEILGPVLRDVDDLHSDLWPRFQQKLNLTTNMDSSQRFEHVIESLQPIVLSHAFASSANVSNLVPALMQWKERCSILSNHIFWTSRDDYIANPDATEYLGSASRRMYKFVRQQLRVPFQAETFCQKTLVASDTNSVTIGSLISSIHAAIRNGVLYVPVMECLRHVRIDDPQP